MLQAVKEWLLTPVKLPLSWYVAVLVATVPNVAWAASEVGTPGRAATLNMAWVLPILALVAAFLGWAQTQVNKQEQAGDEDDGDTWPIDAMEVAHEAPTAPPPAWPVIGAIRNTVSKLSAAARRKPVSHALVISAVVYMGFGLFAAGALIG